MLLALFAASCAQVPHTALHPVGADLYAEVPDVGAAIAAYAKAPAVELVSSEGASNISSLVKDIGFDLQAMAASLLPVADPNRPDDRWWPWSAARKASFSISGLERAPTTGAATPTEMSGWMVCDFAALDAAEQAEKALIAMGGAEPKPAGELAFGSSTTQVVEFGSPFEWIATKAWLARLDTRLVVGIGAAARPEDYTARSNVATGGLAGAWSANDADKVLGAASGVTVLEILSDMDDLPAFAAESASLTYAAMFLTPYLSAKGRWRIELRGDRFVTDGLYEPRGKSSEVLGVFGTASVPANAIEFLPPDAVGTWITDVDAARAESVIGALLLEFDGAPIATPAPGQPRMSDGLKSTMAMSLLPFQSLMAPTPRVLMTLELSDAAKFQAGLDAWIANAKVAQPDLTTDHKTYRKVKTITLGTGKDEAEPGGGGMASPLGGMSLEPKNVTIAVLDDRVIFGSVPTVVRNEIKRLQEDSETAPHSVTHTLQRPAESFEVSTMDWGSYLSKVYDGLRGLAPMLGQNLEKPIEIEKLPTSAQLFAKFQPTTSWARRVDGRIRMHSESSFGPETPVALAAVGFMAMRASRLPAPAPTKAAEPAPAAESPSTEAAGDAERVATLAALREVRTAIAVYRSQFNVAPEKAADLLNETDAFPDGFLKSGAVPNDGWGRALIYAARAGGASYTLHSTGPDGIDQQGAGDDVRLP